MAIDAKILKYCHNNRLRYSVEDYCCANFQVIAIRGFHFIVLKYIPPHIYPYTHTHISSQSHRNIGAAVLRRRRR